MAAPFPTQTLWLDRGGSVTPVSGPVSLVGTDALWSTFSTTLAWPPDLVPPADFPAGTAEVVASLNVPGVAPRTIPFALIEADGGLVNAWGGDAWTTDIVASVVDPLVDTCQGKDAGGATIWTRTAQVARTDVADGTPDYTTPAALAHVLGRGGAEADPRVIGAVDAANALVLAWTPQAPGQDGTTPPTPISGVTSQVALELAQTLYRRQAVTGGAIDYDALAARLPSDLVRSFRDSLDAVTERWGLA